MTHPIIEQIKKADRAIVAEDFDTLLDIYTDDAVLVVEPGKNAEGKVNVINLADCLVILVIVSRRHFFSLKFPARPDGFNRLDEKFA